ncbi:cerebellin-2-like [Mizuhopecten yessoensis]|uniref:cerebellin-2-like n=1 Tax=Mizuhopecten yessoensis TaxID=6573 RepID=UPI000B4576DD|nr:cerebellin-2-like [Mizuhopecten yessoensis]
MATFSFIVIVLLASDMTQGAPSSNSGNNQDQEITEIKKMMTSQADMLQEYGRRINLLEKENHDLVKQTEKLQTANAVMETRLGQLEQMNFDICHDEDAFVTTAQLTEEDKGQLHSSRFQDQAVPQADDKLSRIRKVANEDNHTAVGFYARLSPHTLQLGEHQTLEFDHVVTNVGNGYDSRHGHFTAPVAGLFSFTSTVLLSSSNNHLMQLNIVKNGVDIGHLFSYSALDKGTRTVVLQLSVGDMVWVRNRDNNSPEIFGLGYTTFSGFLITPLGQS